MFPFLKTKIGAKIHISSEFSFSLLDFEFFCYLRYGMIAKDARLM